jgi:hypothetical protein
MSDYLAIMIQIIADRVKKESEKAMSLGAISESEYDTELERIGKLEGHIMKEAQRRLCRKKTRRMKPRSEGH